MRRENQKMMRMDDGDEIAGGRIYIVIGIRG
jgi:hypothetical protein